jgi:hypothetical protein
MATTKRSFSFEQVKGIRKGIDFLTGKLLADTEALEHIDQEEAKNLLILSDFKSQLSEFIEDLEQKPNDQAQILTLGEVE